jgi:hypothetical protein
VQRLSTVLAIRYACWLGRCVSYAALIVSLIGAAQSLVAQTPEQADTLIIRTTDTLQLRAKNLVPFTEVLTIGTDRLPSSSYWFDSWNGRLFVRDTTLHLQQVVVRYRTFNRSGALPAYQLRIPNLRADSLTEDSLALQSLDTTIEFIDTKAYKEALRQNQLIETSKLTTRGALSRGVTFGSNADVGVTSDFRLQLDGQLANDIDLSAAITDANIPIQPNGNTQQINDFDRIFIQLKKNKFKVLFGDFEVSRTGTQFVNLYRNVLGVQAHYQGSQHQVSLNAAAAKGQFHTNSFPGENGKQGPYRLRGKNNEQFFVILAGSERVYLNGQLMRRGEDQDYTMDYNTAELRFTPRRPINTTYRIVVDFEYADRNYNRSLLAGSWQGSFFSDRLKTGLLYTREADDPDAPIDFTFSSRERQALAQAGDQSARALTSGIDSVGYLRTEPRYQRLDTVVNAQPVSIYQLSTDSARAVFRVSFLYVGPGRGTYRKQSTALNTNLFQFVGTDENGIPLGDYLPGRVVPLPRQIQVVASTAELAVGSRRNWVLYNETAISSHDKNRLSALDDADNTGLATRSGLRLQKSALGQSSWSCAADVQARWVDPRFTNIDRVYKMEYGRDWNFNDTAAQRLAELVYEGSFDLYYKEKHQFRYATGYRTTGDASSTVRQAGEWQSTDTTLLAGRANIVWLSTRLPTGAGGSSEWLRHTANVFRRFGPLLLGVETWTENREELRQDTVRAGSFRLREFKPYIQTAFSRKLTGSLSYLHRYDDEWLQGVIRPKSLTQTASARLGWQPLQGLVLQVTGHYNRFTVRDSAFVAAGQRNTDNILGNLTFGYTSANRLVSVVAGYETQTERIARSQEVYVKVTTGMGTYVWQDFNSDGLQQLNEFVYPPNGLLGDYVRLYIPTQNLFPATAILVTGQFRLDFSGRIKKSSRFFQEWLRQTTFMTNLQLTQRTQSEQLQIEDYLPRLGAASLLDTTLLNATQVLRHEIACFRGNRRGDFSVFYTDNRSRQFLASGLDSRSLEMFGSRQRLYLSRKVSLEQQLTYFRKDQVSRAELVRNFDLVGFTLQPTVVCAWSRRFRTSTGYEVKTKKNTETRADSLPEQLVSHKVFKEFRLNYGSRNTLSCKVEWLTQQLVGTPDPLVRFELLEGNQNGNNFILNLNLVHYLSRNLELSVVYDGRFNRQQPALHSSRMQLRALF